MKKPLIAAALAAALALPALAAAQLPGSGAAPSAPAQGGAERAARREAMMARMKAARAVGYAEALGLDEAGALRAREIMARFDERRVPLHRQAREAMAQVRRAARGEAAAQQGLDAALGRLHDLRDQMQGLHEEMFQALTQGLAPQQKARAALFFGRFRAEVMRSMGRGGGPFGEGHGRGLGSSPGNGPGPGAGPGMGFDLDVE